MVTLDETTPEILKTDTNMKKYTSMCTELEITLKFWLLVSAAEPL
jgi:hypothetical protein